MSWHVCKYICTYVCSYIKIGKEFTQNSNRMNGKPKVSYVCMYIQRKVGLIQSTDKEMFQLQNKKIL